MEKIVALAKSRGFIYPGSEIYGGLANTWDYGNLGVEFKNNVKKAWWKKFIQENPYNVGVDCAILMNPQTWVASGHLGSFSDPLMDCKECHERFRADKIMRCSCLCKREKVGVCMVRSQNSLHRNSNSAIFFKGSSLELPLSMYRPSSIFTIFSRQSLLSSSKSCNSSFARSVLRYVCSVLSQFFNFPWPCRNLS